MPDSDNDDAADVNLTLAGDSDAFARLVNRHGQAVSQQMRSFSPDPAVSEELAHDVFAEAYLSLASWRGDAPFRHWLARIASFTGYRYWKTQKKRRRETAYTEEMDIPAPPCAPPPARQDPEAARELLFQLLSFLPDRDRLVLSLVYLENCTTAETAERLGWSRAAVAMRVFKAKRKLQRIAAREPWKGKVQWMIS